MFISAYFSDQIPVNVYTDLLANESSKVRKITNSEQISGNRTMSSIYILCLFSLYTLCLAVPFVHRTEGGVNKIQLINEKLSDLEKALRQIELRKQNDIVQADAVEPMNPSTLATTTDDTLGGIDLQALKEALDKLRQGHDEKQEDSGSFLETPIELSSVHQKEIDLASPSNDWKQLAQEMQKQRDELFLLNGGKWAGVIPSEDNDKLVEVLRQKEIKLVENQFLEDVENAKKLGISVNDIISDMQKSSSLSKVPSQRR